MIYLDYNAASPPFAQVIELFANLSHQNYANFASSHQMGRKKLLMLEEASLMLQNIFNAHDYKVVFTSGGTESCNLAINSTKDSNFYVTQLEHPAILSYLLGNNLEHQLVKVSQGLVDGGIIDLNHLEALCKKDINPPTLSVAPTPLININLRNSKPRTLILQLANSETGIIQPLKEVCELAQKYDVRIICDATQAIGKMHIDLADLPVDYFIGAAYKSGGMLGSSFLLVKDPNSVNPMVLGGSQQQNMRAGNLDVNIIHVNNLAIELAYEVLDKLIASPTDDKCSTTRLNSWAVNHDFLVNELERLGAAIYGSKHQQKLKNTLCIYTPKISNIIQLMHFDLHNIMLSIGSACASGTNQPSSTLLAMGSSKQQALNSIRLSFGHATTIAELETFLRVYQKLL